MPAALYPSSLLTNISLSLLSVIAYKFSIFPFKPIKLRNFCDISTRIGANTDPHEDNSGILKARIGIMVIVYFKGS